MAASNPMNSDRKAVIWREWKKGVPMSVICRLIEKPPATVFSYLRYHEGIEPRIKTRRPSTLSLREREEVSRGLAGGISIRSIARTLGRSPSTISREITKNGGAHRYRASDADLAAFKGAMRPKECRLTSNDGLRQLVAEKLSEDWSPEQISGWLRVNRGSEEGMQVSHETIYKSLFIQTRGLFKKELRKHLRTGRKFRHSRNHRSGYRELLMAFQLVKGSLLWKTEQSQVIGRETLSAVRVIAMLPPSLSVRPDWKARKRNPWLKRSRNRWGNCQTCCNRA